MNTLIKKIGKSIVKKGIDYKSIRFLTSILYKKARIGIYQGLFDYCNQNDCVIELINDEPHEGRLPSANEYELENVKRFGVVTSYKIYIAKLNDVFIYGWSDIIRKDNLLLTDRIVYDEKDYERYSPRWIVESKDSKALYFEYKNPEKIEKGIYLVKMWSENWTHFLVETISRLQFLDSHPEYDNYPILLDSHLFKDTRNIEVIKLFNKRNHPIIKIEMDKMYEVKELIFPSQYSWFPFDIENSKRGIGWAINSTYLKNARKVFWNEFKAENLDPNRTKYNYYLARGNNKRLKNEDEVVNFFRTKGFVILDTSKMTLKEEVECFINANAIVCMMGSGLANMLFCDENTSVFEFCPLRLQHDSFAYIADPLGIKNYHRVNVDLEREGEQIAESQLYVRMDKLEYIMSILEQDNMKREKNDSNKIVETH